MFKPGQSPLRTLQWHPLLSYGFLCCPQASTGLERWEKKRLSPQAFSWLPNGFPIAPSWPPHGFLMVSPWIPHSSLLASSWPPHGFLMASSNMESRPVEAPRATPSLRGQSTHLEDQRTTTPQAKPLPQAWWQDKQGLLEQHASLRAQSTHLETKGEPTPNPSPCLKPGDKTSRST